MDFSLSEEQQMLVDSVAEFADRESPVSRARRLRDDAVGWERGVWQTMAELGWLAVPFPEEVGGLGWRFADVALILEQLGKHLVPEPLVPSLLAGHAVATAGDASQRARFLTPLLEGATTLALATEERGHRYDTRPTTTTATPDGDGWRVRGEKIWVANGHAADAIVVSAQAPEGPSLFVCDPEDVEILPAQTLDGRRAAFLTFDTRAAGDRLLGPAGSALPLLDHLADLGAALSVAEGVGVCARTLELTLEHLKSREQFGALIGSFQALQHRAVDMFVEVELLRSIALESSVRLDEDDASARRRAVSAAKFQLATGGKQVVRQAIQLHGGIGCTDEHDVGLYFKRLHALDLSFGDETWHVRRFAREPGFL